jgi:hypothetical protein
VRYKGSAEDKFDYFISLVHNNNEIVESKKIGMGGGGGGEKLFTRHCSKP